MSQREITHEQLRRRTPPGVRVALRTSRLCVSGFARIASPRTHHVGHLSNLD